MELPIYPSYKPCVSLVQFLRYSKLFSKLAYFITQRVYFAPIMGDFILILPSVCRPETKVSGLPSGIAV